MLATYEEEEEKRNSTHANTTIHSNSNNNSSVLNKYTGVSNTVYHEYSVST